MKYFGTDEEILEQKKEEAKRRRDVRLRESDKYMLADFPITDENREEVRAYRKALRDFPEQAGFPDIKLPARPAFMG